MWNFAALAVLFALTGLYASYARDGMAQAEQARAENIVGEMAVYRTAVVDYFTLQPAAVQVSINLNQLAAQNVVPTWSTLFTQPASSIWANYRTADGTIYIYAATPPRVNVVAEMLAYSQNSVLAGVFRAGDLTLYSPVFGDTNIPLPPAAEVSIPVGSPVWIAMRN